MIKYNESTKVIFANDDALTDGIIEIQASDIAKYVADGAIVDASAQAFVPVDSAVPLAPADATATTVADTTGDSAIPLESASETVVEPSGSSVDSTSASSSDSSPATVTPVASTDTPTAAVVADVASAKAADDQAVADEGVDTTKDIGTVVLTPDALGAVTGVPVTPGGMPVVDAQPEAVTVKGAEYPANSPVVAATNVDQSFVGISHESMVDKLLKDLEGIEAMGKSEIKFVVDSLRSAFHHKD